VRRTLAADQVVGPDAVPFNECALANIATLQKVGLKIGMLFTVASRCTGEPACIAEYAVKYAPPSPPGAAVSDAPGAATGADATAANTNAAAVAAAAAAAAAAISVLPSSAKPVDMEEFSPRQKLTIVIAVPSVFAAAAVWACLFFVVRERRRKQLAAVHVASQQEAARDGVGRLDFDDIACVLGGAPTGCAWRGRGRGRKGRLSGDGGGGGGGDNNDNNDNSNNSNNNSFNSNNGINDDNDNSSGDGGERPGGLVLLNHVSGHASRGQMLALLGPSGAGKSTLLKVIAGRSPSDAGLNTSGAVTLDGARQSPRALSRAVAMVGLYKLNPGYPIA
jgi:ATP-binding cassette subfamily G (WHITE) protein 2